MYSEQDSKEIRLRIRKYAIITVIGALILLGASITGMTVNVRSKALTMGASIALYVYICYMVVMYIYPCAKYNGFLNDMKVGLTKEVDCTILEISDKEELQDGVRVRPVRVFLEDEQDERILYINVSKLDQMPAVGAKTHFGCFGRHIKEAQAA